MQDTPPEQARAAAPPDAADHDGGLTLSERWLRGSWRGEFCLYAATIALPALLMLIRKLAQA